MPAMHASRLAFFGAIVLLTLGSDQALAATCYSYYYGYYDCNGLSTGARAGIGIAIAVGILALICLMGYLRKRRTMRAFRQQQQSLPTTQSYPAANTYNYGANYQTPYTMNQTQQSSYYGNGGAGAGVGGGYQPPQGPPPPKEAYRGGSAGEYLHNDVNNVNGGAGSSMPPPPSYVDVSQPNAQGQYAAPSGPPPSGNKAQRETGGGVV